MKYNAVILGRLGCKHVFLCKKKIIIINASEQRSYIILVVFIHLAIYCFIFGRTSWGRIKLFFFSPTQKIITCSIFHPDGNKSNRPLQMPERGTCWRYLSLYILMPCWKNCMLTSHNKWYIEWPRCNFAISWHIQIDLNTSVLICCKQK